MGLFSGKTKTTSTSEPWKPQGDALKDIFSQAGSLYQGSQGTPFYQGDLYANMDPQTAQAIQRMMQYTGGKGQQSADQVSQAGSDLLGSGVNGFNGAIQNYQTAAGGDPTQANIASATAYANNPAVNGMIDAASRDVTRNLYENEIPGVNRAATGSGNINSSRAGIAEGLAMRGAQDQIGDISSNIRGNAYSQGLSLAEGARGTNLNAMGNAAGLYGQQVSQGLGAAAQGNNMNLGNYGASIDASQLYQQDRQGQNDADYAQWQGNDQRQQELLNRYYGTVGANNWGGTQTNTQKSSGSILGTALGIGSMAAGFGAFGGGK